MRPGVPSVEVTGPKTKMTKMVTRKHSESINPHHQNLPDVSIPLQNKWQKLPWCHPFFFEEIILCIICGITSKNVKIGQIAKW